MTGVLESTPVREYRFTIKRGRKWAVLRIEAMQDNSPRHQVRRYRYDISDPNWPVEMAGFIVGFTGEWNPDQADPRPCSGDHEAIWASSVDDMANGVDRYVCGRCSASWTEPLS